MNILQFTYPFICWWTFRLFPHFGYSDYCCSELESANMSLRLWLKLFWVNNVGVEWVKPMMVLFFLFLSFWVTFIFFIMVTPFCLPTASPLPWGFPRQEYWSELPCPPLGDLQPRDRTQVSCIAGRFFTIWATGRLSLTWGVREWSWGCQVRSQNGKSLKVAVTGRAAPKGECKIISDLSLQAGQELHWFQGK